jgi:hypothetical protein
MTPASIPNIETKIEMLKIIEVQPLDPKSNPRKLIIRITNPKISELINMRKLVNERRLMKRLP